MITATLTYSSSRGSATHDVTDRMFRMPAIHARVEWDVNQFQIDYLTVTFDYTTQWIDTDRLNWLWHGSSFLAELEIRRDNIRIFHGVSNVLPKIDHAAKTLSWQFHEYAWLFKKTGVSDLEGRDYMPLKSALQAAIADAGIDASRQIYNVSGTWVSGGSSYTFDDLWLDSSYFGEIDSVMEFVADVAKAFCAVWRTKYHPFTEFELMRRPRGDTTATTTLEDPIALQQEEWEHYKNGVQLKALAASGSGYFIARSGRYPYELVIETKVLTYVHVGGPGTGWPSVTQQILRESVGYYASFFTWPRRVVRGKWDGILDVQLLDRVWETTTQHEYYVAEYWKDIMAKTTELLLVQAAE